MMANLEISIKGFLELNFYKLGKLLKNQVCFFFITLGRLSVS